MAEPIDPNAVAAKTRADPEAGPAAAPVVLRATLEPVHPDALHATLQ